MGEIRDIVIGIMLFSIVVTGLFVISSDLAVNRGYTLHQNLTADPNLAQLALMNAQMASVANQTAQVNYNQQGLLGSFGFLAVIPTGFLSILQEMWIIGTNGAAFIVSGIATYIPLPYWIIGGLLALIGVFVLFAFISLVLGRNA